MKQEITGRLEDWVWYPGLKIYWGFIYDDTRKRFPDGTWIHTSMANPGGKEGDVIETLNSKYLLGKPRDMK